MSTQKHLGFLSIMMDDKEQSRMMQHHTESIIIDSKAKYSIFVILSKLFVKREERFISTLKYVESHLHQKDHLLENNQAFHKIAGDGLEHEVLRLMYY